VNQIETEGLTKLYDRRKDPAIVDVSLLVGNGELFGFLGPNGAGKTTTIRILTTLLRPTRGWARIDGKDVTGDPVEAMRSVGFVPENPGAYASMSGRQNLRYFASLYGLPRPTWQERIEEVLDRVELTEAADRKVRSYSLGMKRRLILAGSLLPDPELLIMDEPTLGLDPNGMAFVRSNEDGSRHGRRG